LTITLARWIDKYGGKTGLALGWDSVDDDFDFIADSALRTYGVATEALATDLDKLYAITKVEFWKAVLVNVAAMYNFSVDGGNYSRSQFHDMAEKNLAMALADAAEYYPGGYIEVGELTTEHNPYLEFPEYSDRAV